MARIRTILSALARLSWRDLRRLGSAGSNNFILFCLADAALPKSSGFFEVVVGLLLLVPLSANPLRRIPASRLAGWPLDQGARTLLTAAGIWLSPVMWISAGLILWTARPFLGVQFLLLALAVHAGGLALNALLVRAPQANLSRHVPDLPGRFGGLVRKDLRQILSTLDPYAGLALALSGVCYRVFARAPEPDASFALALLAVLAMSTWAQCQFGLDSSSGFTRYRLMPVRGWQVLASKDISQALVVLVLVLPLAPVAGLAAALVALAVGHYQSIERAAPLYRWQFTGAGSMKYGIWQAIALLAAGSAAYRGTWLVLPACVPLYAFSLWHCGRMLERQAE